MIKLNQSTLEKLQELCTLAGYTVRHEKGNFRSGSCLVITGKLIVLNKFSTVETRVTFLIQALQNLSIDESLLDQKRLNFLKEVREAHLAAAAEGSDPATESENPSGQAEETVLHPSGNGGDA